MASRRSRRPVSQTNITAEHKANFEALRSAAYNNFCLFSCYVNGTPTSVIACVTKGDGQEIHITPLFVAVTPDMVLTDHDGKQA